MNNPRKNDNNTDVNFILRNDGRRDTRSYLPVSGNYKERTRVHPTFLRSYRARLPMILGFSIVVFAMTFISLLVVVTSSERSEATTKSARPIVIEKEAPIAMVDVLVPVNEIKQGDKLDAAMFKVSRRAMVSVNPDALKSLEELKGQYARSILQKEQPVSRSLVSQVKPANPVIANIQPGFRAVTINVNATTGVEGWASAGAAVDVHWISDILGERTATLIVQNAKVLSAERQVEGAPQQGQPIPTTVTLLVNEKDAQKISLASTGGSIMLHLRGANDIGRGSAASLITFKDLVGKGGKNDSTPVEGFARIKNPDGSVQEWALMGGKLVKKTT